MGVPSRPARQRRHLIRLVWASDLPREGALLHVTKPRVRPQLLIIPPAELNEDSAVLGTVFGPTNVAIHQVAVSVELGNARAALQHAPKVRLGRMPDYLTERRARFLIDVARSHAQLRDYPTALDTLLQAEQTAPDEVRNHRLTHGLVHGLLVRERRSSGLRALADRCGLLS